jgi:Uroporphyrinogen decarboxylase (URO-D)
VCDTDARAALTNALDYHCNFHQLLMAPALARQQGGSSKHCLHVKSMMMKEPLLFHSYMTKIARSIANYACYQADQGAQVSAQYRTHAANWVTRLLVK